MLRDEIAYEIYKTGRASKATMSFEEFVASDCCYADTPTWRDAADTILVLEKIRKALSQSQAYDELMANGGKEMKEKAEKWDKLGSTIYVAMEKANDLDLIMDRMMVREKCKLPDCCDGMWHEREATPEEVRECLTHLFSKPLTNLGGYEFNLKSGATLFMKEKE